MPAEIAALLNFNLFTDDGHIRPLDNLSADVIRIAIWHYDGRISEAARHLGVGRSTLHRMVLQRGLQFEVEEARLYAARAK